MPQSLRATGSDIIIKRLQEVSQSYRGSIKCHNHKEIPGTVTIIERPQEMSIIERPQHLSQSKSGPRKCHRHKDAPRNITIIEAPGSATIIEVPRKCHNDRGTMRSVQITQYINIVLFHLTGRSNLSV